MRIRRVLLAAPIVVLSIFACSFLVARPYFGDRVDQMTMMYPIEPEMLNPVLATTRPAGIVMSFIFDGLLDFDENVEVKPQLAESYHLTQSTRLYFASSDDAAGAAGKIREHEGEWAKAKLREVQVDGDVVVLQLVQAGTAYQEMVLGWIAPLRPVPIQKWLGEFADKPTFQGKPVTSDMLIEWVEKVKGQSPRKPRVLYAWKNTSINYEIFTVGADGAFMDSLQRQFAEYIGTKVEPVKAAVSSPATTTAPSVVESSIPPAMRMRQPGLLSLQFGAEWSAQDEPVITFHLRKHVKWHDGVPFTSADAAFVYEATMSEANASPRRSDFELIRFVETPDDYTFVVTYKEPYSPCLYSWANMPPLPKHLLAGEANLRNLTKSNFNRMPIGTGPFRIAEWASDQYIRLERFDDYWEGKPHLPRITFRVIPDSTVSQMEFQTRGFDYTPVEVHQVKRYQSDNTYDVFRYPANAFSYIGWNMERPMFRDKRVRQALAHAIDVNAIIQYVMYGNGTPCTGPFTPVTPWFNPDIKPFEYNPQKAKQLLAEAGWTDTDGDGIVDRDGEPFRFTFITASGSAIGSDLAVLSKDYLRAIGIDANINTYEWTVYIDKYIEPRSFDACIMSWSLGFDQDLYQIFHSSQIRLPNSLNHTSYSNPEADRLMELARTEFDLEKVKEYTRRMQAVIYDDQPYVFLFYMMTNVAIPKGSYHVERPEKGERIAEPIRPTKLGVTVYQRWWAKGPMEMPPG